MAQAPLKPSSQLAEVLGSAAPVSRPQVATKVWDYIKKHKLAKAQETEPFVGSTAIKEEKLPMLKSEALMNQ
jgi:SWIB/MDM2 domain